MSERPIIVELNPDDGTDLFELEAEQEASREGDPTIEVRTVPQLVPPPRSEAERPADATRVAGLRLPVATPAPTLRVTAPPTSRPAIVPMVAAVAADNDPAPVVTTRTSARPAGQTLTVSLHDVAIRQVPVYWFEAVAVILEAGETSIAREPHTPVPDASGILLTSEGTVLLRHSGGGEAPVAALARMLHDLLSRAGSVPAGLRLLATAAGDAYPTTADFTAALAYFGRPDRRELIRALYERCAAAPVLAQPQSTSDAAPATDVAESRGPTIPPWLPIAAIVVLAIVAFLGVSWIWSSGSGEHSPAAAAVRETQRVAEAVTDGIRTTLGLQSTAHRAPTPPASESRPAAARPRERRMTVRPTPRKRASVPPSIPLPSRRGGSREAVYAFPRSSLTLPPDPAAVIVADETVIVPATVDKPVYSSQDEEVRPPVMTYPQLHQSALPEINSPVVNRLELLVGEDGSVERVKMLSRPRRMSDMMILSGIKMWRFRPASRAGRPVKYLTVLNWTVTP